MVGGSATTHLAVQVGAGKARIVHEREWVGRRQQRLRGQSPAAWDLLLEQQQRCWQPQPSTAARQRACQRLAQLQRVEQVDSHAATADRMAAGACDAVGAAQGGARMRREGWSVCHNNLPRHRPAVAGSAHPAVPAEALCRHRSRKRRFPARRRGCSMQTIPGGAEGGPLLVC